jgi:lipoyl(octanoyl) transferase
MKHRFKDLGRVSYADALERQRACHAELVAARAHGGGEMTVFTLEHDPPVITLTRRPGVRAHLLATPEHLLEHGIEVVETDRGGDITYHGPGQLVAYPILDLNRLGLRIHPYMRLLEDVVIETVASFGIDAGREEGATGVWVSAGTPEARKIAALGVRLSRWCSMHGLALNVDPDLSHFDLIVPCGLSGRPVTSLRRELGEDCPSIERVRDALERAFNDALERLEK